MQPRFLFSFSIVNQQLKEIITIIRTKSKYKKKIRF